MFFLFFILFFSYHFRHYLFALLYWYIISQICRMYFQYSILERFEISANIKQF